jgi:hypothetical protein
MSNSGLRFATWCFLLCAVLFAGLSNSGPLSGEAERRARPASLRPHAIVCWGDSMTLGYDGETDIGNYPEILQSIIGTQVVNMGIGGQTSTQIGVREGAIPSFATVVGGWIPRTRGVTVKFVAGYEPLTDPLRTIRGSMAGVEGVLTLSDFLPNGGVITFTPVPGNPAPVKVRGTPRFIPDTPYRDFQPIFWEGRNNLLETPSGPWGPARIESDIAAQVATFPANSKYLVLPVINENYAGERRGQPNYDTLLSLDHALAATYREHFLDIRSILVRSYDPSSPVDVTDHHYDMIPTSLGAISGQGTLVSNIGPADTTFTVNITGGSLIPYHNLVIDHELIRVFEIDGSKVMFCTRGYGGVLASHPSGAAITQHDPTHLNKQGYAVVANAVARKLATM